MRRLIAVLFVMGLFTIAGSFTAAQDFPLSQLTNCEGGAFSVEEDFVMQDNEPYDGNPYISDGDVLSPSGQLCARNAELLRIFQVQDDLGLDALQVFLNAQGENEHIVAFSTELDDPNGNFTAGDLLFTNGAVLPNRVLARRFDIPYDIGLDAVHITGETERIVDLARSVGRDDVNADELVSLLRELEIDILFSVEGTGGIAEEGLPRLLDGDVLSFVTGTVVASNRDLLGYAPAGIPDGGVDFGLDALVATGEAVSEDDVERFLFSTEILYEGEISFTDGDILTTSGVMMRNPALIARFAPAAEFLGLDALWLERTDDTVRPPSIDRMCGDRNVEDFDGGLAIPGGPTDYSGLYTRNSFDADPTNDADLADRPCGANVPIDGNMPDDVSRFRVAYREAGTVAPGSVGAADAIQTTWHVTVPQFVVVPGVGLTSRCIYNRDDPSTYLELSTDSDGWMNATQYLAAESGALTGCPLNLWLAVWDTRRDAPDPDGRYVVWLEWEDASGLNREPVEHYVQLDNQRPNFTEFEVRLTDGETVVPPCGETTGETTFQIWAQFEDPHYGHFDFSLEGGRPPAIASSRHFYYESDDGTPGIDNTDDTGTVPDGSIVHVRDLDMTTLGDSFVDCCYLVRMRVSDRSIRHGFNNRTVNGAIPNRTTYSFQTFAASP